MKHKNISNIKTGAKKRVLRKKIAERTKKKVARKPAKRKHLDIGSLTGKKSLFDHIKGSLVAFSKKKEGKSIPEEGRIISMNEPVKEIEIPIVLKEARKNPAKKAPAKKRKKAVAEETGLMNLPKPRVAIVSLTSCEGCQFVLLDLGERFFEFVKSVELVDFRMVEDQEDDNLQLDLVLVEGNPVTEENVETLKRVRARAKVLAALGNCAAMGGVPEIKNYQKGKSTIKHVYKYIHGISNPEIKEIDNFVKVDFVFPGCPIDGEEFLKYMPELLKGNVPQIPDQAVCLECRKKGNKCLLLEKKPCFGPMILGGCDAVCPTARMGCQGCRGLRPEGSIKVMRATLKSMMTDEEFENVTEIYGLRDDLEEKEKKEKKEK
ncbi:MAG: hypothetical protein HGB08_00705 [Candidatus Moranbacteria bacterium]|nr:hypothetical protein [Candidatus Moranbacteria bacterium]